MSDLYLRSGIFMAPFHNHDENPTLSIERDLELLEHLDRLNYHEAWIGEHHSGGFELIACPEMFIAAAAQRTRHIRLGTGVVSLPYHNPFMLAARMLAIGGTAPAQMERHTANWGLYEETARANGYTPNRKDWRVVGFFHIADTREQARQNVRFGVQAFANYFRDVATFPIIPPDVGDPVEWLIETGTACIGTPDDAIAYNERLN